MIDYKKKYKKYKYKYMQHKLTTQHGGIRPFRITGPVLFNIYKMPALNKIFYLFGDDHFGHYYKGCEGSRPEFCDMKPNCYDIKTLINEIIYTNIVAPGEEWIDIFLETYFYVGDTTEHRIREIRNISKLYENVVYNRSIIEIEPMEYTLQKDWYRSPLGEVIGLFTKCIKYKQCFPFTRVHMVDTRGGDEDLSYYTEYIKEILNIMNMHSSIRSESKFVLSSQHIKQIFKSDSVYKYGFKKMMGELMEVIGINLSQSKKKYKNILLSKLRSILETTKISTEIDRIPSTIIRDELIKFIDSELEFMVNGAYGALWDSMKNLWAAIHGDTYNNYPDVAMEDIVRKSRIVKRLLDNVYDVIQPIGTTVMDFYAIARMFKEYPHKIIVYAGYIHTKTYTRFLMQIGAQEIFKSVLYRKRLAKKRCIEVSIDSQKVINFNV